MCDLIGEYDYLRTHGSTFMILDGQRRGLASLRAAADIPPMDIRIRHCSS
jgi:hypothetical protein